MHDNAFHDSKNLHDQLGTVKSCKLVSMRWWSSGWSVLKSAVEWSFWHRKNRAVVVHSSWVLFRKEIPPLGPKSVIFTMQVWYLFPIWDVNLPQVSLILTAVWLSQRNLILGGHSEPYLRRLWGCQLSLMKSIHSPGTCTMILGECVKDQPTLEVSPFQLSDLTLQCLVRPRYHALMGMDFYLYDYDGSIEDVATWISHGFSNVTSKLVLS